ncbi:Protein SUR7 [Candida viswanathii]|uniref:Protein SUR7 n=1 Tax=Candida viswanathii TaxID=5486 RepID=A0A367YIF9_9ASCO|nr:Protein SUR7 [Candida viswanathii]
MRAFTIVPIFFLLGSSLLLILTVINGSGTSNILGRFWWSQTDTSGLTGVPFSSTRWTFYRICENVNNQIPAAFPYSPLDNFGEDSGIPQEFIDHRDTYYYSSRIGWAFSLIALFFTVVATVFTPLNFCFRFGGIVAIVATVIALIFDITGATAWNRAGFPTALGAAAFAILWTSVFTLAVSLVSLIISIGRSKGPGGAAAGPAAYYPKDANENSSFQRGTYSPHPDGEPVSDTSKFRFFRVKRAKPEDA